MASSGLAAAAERDAYFAALLARLPPSMLGGGAAPAESDSDSETESAWRQAKRMVKKKKRPLGGAGADVDVPQHKFKRQRNQQAKRDRLAGAVGGDDADADGDAAADDADGDEAMNEQRVPASKPGDDVEVDSIEAVRTKLRDKMAKMRGGRVEVTGDGAEKKKMRSDKKVLRAEAAKKAKTKVRFSREPKNNADTRTRPVKMNFRRSGDFAISGPTMTIAERSAY